MSALSSAFSGLWYNKDASATALGKVELPLLENEPLGSPLGKTEKCELRIEGMTCGSCVEVSRPAPLSPLSAPTH
jgi:Cu+-exporting ATPase